jgi:hypothetical protein
LNHPEPLDMKYEHLLACSVIQDGTGAFNALNICLGVVALILFGDYLVGGIRYALYKPAGSDQYLWAVYHVHSTMSDGLGSPEEIARQARMARVSLVLLTDHGNPNLAATALHELIDGVTVIGGSEARLPAGRLTYFGARDLPHYSLSPFPPDAMSDARRWGAFPVVAYSDDPLYGWHYWEKDLAPGGLEVLNLFTCVRGLSFADKLLLGLYYPFSRFYFLKGISFPAKSLAHWDEFLQRGKTWGLVAADAHGGFRLGQWITPHIPSYADTFSLIGLGIDKRYASQPELAVRNGDFFNCIRGAGEPLFFEFSARYHRAKFLMGSTAPEGSDLRVQVQTSNQALRIVLRKDGKPVTSVDAGELEIPSVEPGVYRVEVYLLDHPLLPPEVPWIVSNPIFLGSAPSERIHRSAVYSDALKLAFQRRQFRKSAAQKASFKSR